MDLSSLEGPPILDHSPARDPPSMRLDALPSLGLPPRPASADAVSRIYSLQSQPQSQSQLPSHSYSRSQSHLVPYPQLPPHSHNLPPTSHPDSNLPPHYRRARTPSPTPIAWRTSPSTSPNNNANSSARHARRTSPSPQRLVWLDAEKSWVVVSGEQTTSVYTPACHGCNCGGGGANNNLSAANANVNASHHTGTHSRHRTHLLPTMNMPMGINPAADLYPPPTVDAPPPYEQHVFDKPLVQVQVHGPGGSRRRGGRDGGSSNSHSNSYAESGTDSASGSEGEPSRGRTGGGSRWTAVARRLRASPVR